MFYIMLPAFFALCYGLCSKLSLILSILSSSRTKVNSLKPESVRTAVKAPTRAVNQELQIYKTLYHQLHNLEHYPKALPQAREVLLGLFAQGTDCAIDRKENNILDIKTFEPDVLASFIRGRDDAIGLRWEEYASRRRAGGLREMFPDREAAKYWLRQRAPSKYVDGAWLGHIHRTTTPFHLRQITKNAWQVLSEELGDGDLEKNHAHVYRNLMSELDSGLPGADSIGFIHPSLGLDSVPIWKGALAQLAISLFPHDFLPEILGFNLHFEMLTWDTLRAIKELRELGIDDYYFRLHISIDNADTGHTAMALKIVVDYMQTVQATMSEEEAAQVWKRVQAGFLLSDMFDHPENKPAKCRTSISKTFTTVEAEIVRMFRNKAIVSQKLHCACRVKMGGRPLAEWLEPRSFDSIEKQRAFLDAFSRATPWIRPGDSKSSRFIQQISWKGQMFGAFTHAEVETLERWINTLPLQSSPNSYWEFVGLQKSHDLKLADNQDICSSYPVFQRNHTIDWPQIIDSKESMKVNVDVTQIIKMEKFLPLWFSQQSLLESFVSVPFRTCNESTSAIIRVLRVQYGFAAEEDNIAGMSELVRNDAIGLVDIGLHIMDRAGLEKPVSLAHVMRDRDSTHAEMMLELSMRPRENALVLIGMAAAFAELHRVMATSSDCQLLDRSTASALRTISEREKLGLEACLKEMVPSSERSNEFCKGFAWAKMAIEECRQT